MAEHLCAEDAGAEPHTKFHVQIVICDSIKLRVHSFGVILIRISEPKSLGSWFTKGTDESMTRLDSSVRLIHYDPNDLGLLILIHITSKGHIQVFQKATRTKPK